MLFFQLLSTVQLLLIKLGENCEKLAGDGLTRNVSPKKATVNASFCFSFSEFYCRMNQGLMVTDLRGSVL